MKTVFLKLVVNKSSSPRTPRTRILSLQPIDSHGQTRPSPRCHLEETYESTPLGCTVSKCLQPLPSSEEIINIPHSTSKNKAKSSLLLTCLQTKPQNDTIHRTHNPQFNSLLSEPSNNQPITSLQSISLTPTEQISSRCCQTLIVNTPRKPTISQEFYSEIESSNIRKSYDASGYNSHCSRVLSIIETLNESYFEQEKMAYREKTNATEEREMTKESKHSEGLLTMSSRAGKKIPVLLRPRKFQEKKDKKEQEQQDGLL